MLNKFRQRLKSNSKRAQQADDVGAGSDQSGGREYSASAEAESGEGELTHAQEDQQAEGDGSLFEGAPDYVDSEGALEGGTSGTGALRDDVGEVDDPITWEDTPDLSELTEEEIAELERQWRARRGLPAPTEAAE